MIHPSRRSFLLALAGLALALLPVLVTPASWVVWAAFWLVFILWHALDLALAVRPRAWGVELALPQVLAVGRARSIDVVLTTRRPRSFDAEVRLDLSDGLERQGVRSLRGREGRAVGRFVLRPERRGRVAVERAWVRYTGPFGLIRRVHSIDLDAEATAAPDLEPVHRAAIRFQSERGREGLKIERYPGEGSEFDSLREFLPGHDPRAIDWKASARHTRLLVRQFRAERDQQIVLAVDSGRLMGEPIEGVTRLDHAIHASLVLAYIGLRSGDRVGVYAFDARPRFYLPPRSGLKAFPAVVRRSGEIDYGPEETNYTLGLTNLSTRLRRRSLVIVFTDFSDSITAELMVENLGRLARRHLTLFVTPRDPFLEELTDASPRSLQVVNRAVVARGLLRERETVLRKLRRAGILHVEAPPQAIGAELVNRYLEIKRRERI